MNNFQNSNQFTNQNQQTQPLNAQTQQGLFSLPPSLMSMVPWIPFFLEATTGQKIPQMSGTIAEIQQGIQRIQLSQVQIIQQQQNLEQRLANLETNASNQFTNLVNQVQSIKSVRLTHDRERKQIDYNLNPESAKEY